MPNVFCFFIAADKEKCHKGLQVKEPLSSELCKILTSKILTVFFINFSDMHTHEHSLITDPGKNKLRL